MIDTHKNVLIVLIHFFHYQKRWASTFRCFHFLNPLFQILLPSLSSWTICYTISLASLISFSPLMLFSQNILKHLRTFENECSQIFLIQKNPSPQSILHSFFHQCQPLSPLLHVSIIPHLHYNLAFTGLTAVSKRFRWKKWIWRRLHLGKSVLKKQKVVSSTGICNKTRNIYQGRHRLSL